MKHLKWLVFTAVLYLEGVNSEKYHEADAVDNEFAEFEDFDDETWGGFDEPAEEETVRNLDEEQTEEEDDEFVDMKHERHAIITENEELNLQEFDPDEFEEDRLNLGHNHGSTTGKRKPKSEAKFVPSDFPLHAKSWNQYHMEILMGFGLVVYILNYFMGRYINSKIASWWLRIHRALLESQFELVGDDTQNKSGASTMELVKEGENVFTLWCSGRICVDSMLVELHLLNRQDMVSIIANMMKPARDKVFISVTLEDMDSFVMAVGRKKSLVMLQKRMQDVANYCGDKICSADKYNLQQNIMITAEIWSEVGNVLDAKILKIINENERFFEYLHISDQFSGPKLSVVDKLPTEKPETSKKLILALNMHCNRQNPMQADIVKMVPLMRMVLYLADKLYRFKLSKESKLKAEKNRQKIEAAFVKPTHTRRQEAQRKED